MSNFLPGLKTYVGIAVTLFGTLAQAMGWGWFEAISADVQMTVNQIIAVVGGIIAIYGRAAAKPKA